MRIILAILLCAGSAMGANKHVIPGGATGNGLGGDWNNALGQIPGSSAVRGDTYYVADGTLAGFTASSANSGTTRITIKKATVAEHGSSTGWVNNMGDGQTFFSGSIVVHSGYWTMDGAARDESNPPFSWKNGTAYGFSFLFAGSQIIHSDGGGASGETWIVKHCEFGRPSLNVEGDSTTSVYLFGALTGAHTWTFQRCYFHDSYITVFCKEWNNYTIEYCYMARSYNKEMFRAQYQTDGWIIRYNVFEDMCITSHASTGGGNTAEIGQFGSPGNDGWEIYGNVFFNTGLYSVMHNNGVIYIETGSNSKVYNNDFINLSRIHPGGGAGVKQWVVLTGGSGNICHNNLWLDVPDGSTTGTVAQNPDIEANSALNNWIHPPNTAGLQTSFLGRSPVVTRWPTTLIGSSDPLIDWRAGNFEPKDPASVSGNDIVGTGAVLGGGYASTDMLGNLWEHDGVRDIGALARAGGVACSDTQPPTVPTGLDAAAVSQSQIDLVWTASTDDCSAIVYRILRNDSQVGISSTTAFSDTGLAPNTTYTYKIVAADSATPTPHVSAASAADSATTLTLDTTVPSKPTNLTITALSASSVFFTWYASSDNIGVVQYFIYRGGSHIGTSTVTNFTDTGLAPETTYAYSVAALDAAGNISVVSVSTNVTTLTAPDFPTNGMALWLRADVGVLRDHTDNIYQWQDQSGQGRHAEQSAVTLQPRYNTNRLRSVQFSPSQYLTFTLPVNGLTAMTIYMVANNTTNLNPGNSQAERTALFWNETLSWGTLYVSPAQTHVVARFGSTQANNRMLYTRPESLLTNFSITTFIKSNTTTDRLYVNGAKVVEETGKQAIAGCQPTGNIGRGYNFDTYFTGDIQEILIYTNTAHTVTEREQVEDYLNEKWFTEAPDPDTTAPSIPMGLTATAFSPTRIDVSWTASTDNVAVDHYVIFRNGAAIGNPTGVTFNDVGLSPSTAYTYTVLAVDTSMNMSAASAEDVESTPAEPAVTSKPLRKPRGGSSVGKF